MGDDNVTPIAPVQECASCGSRHTHAERFRLDAHIEGCMQPEIRMKRLEARVQKLGWENDELRTSLLALARHLLTPGECLAPDAPMYCGGSDLCPCRTDGAFHGTCGINETLVSLLQADILEQRKRGVAPPWWARVQAKEKQHGEEPAPDTQRIGSPVRTYACSACYFGLGAGHSAHTCGAHADASAAEPERSPTAGAEPAGDAPGHT